MNLGLEMGYLALHASNTHQTRTELDEIEKIEEEKALRREGRAPAEGRKNLDAMGDDVWLEQFRCVAYIFML